MIGYLKEICSKLWSLGKLAIPGVALLELFRYLGTVAFGWVAGWIGDKIDGIKALISDQMGQLATDLTPPAAFMDWIAKINVVVPLSEMWHYFLLYLSIASVLVGLKWFRNLVPGFK